MSMKIFNTMSRRLEEFEPLEGPSVRMYTCGPTVYNFAHIGNFRAYMFEDILRRTLKFCGYQVTQVMNLTDVDDKTIRGARAAGTSLDAYTRPFKDAFFADLAALGIERAEHYPAATDHVAEMLAMIARLLENGAAYRSEDGSIYFNVGKWAAYGKLAHLDMSGLKAGARVAHDEYDKESVSDFALWKAWDAEDGDVAWDSPWGRGRPGWHIECSAMSMKYLGESFDLHTGGVDNMFPHHENEIAQSEAFTGKPFVKYWMHCGYLLVDGTKMSKSLGNFYTLRDIFERGYSGREVRYVLLAGQYRQSLNFAFDALHAARASLARTDEFCSRLLEAAGGETQAGRLPAWAEAGQREFKASLENDLGVPEALSAVFQVVHAGNKDLAAGALGAKEALAVYDLLGDFDKVLGVLQKPEDVPPAEIAALAAERDAARKAKDWARSDLLRSRLQELGWQARDTRQGCRMRRGKA